LEGRRAEAVASGGGSASGNGRFPRADQLVLVPGSRDELVLRTTFGLLLSSDAGASWDWVCEQEIGFSGIEDPAFAILPNGERHGGCSFASASAPLGHGRQRGMLALLLSVQSIWRTRRQSSGQGKRGSRTIQIG
jgi:hypothetical protein